MEQERDRYYQENLEGEIFWPPARSWRRLREIANIGIPPLRQAQGRNSKKYAVLLHHRGCRRSDYEKDGEGAPGGGLLFFPTGGGSGPGCGLFFRARLSCLGGADPAGRRSAVVARRERNLRQERK